ncbi:YgaP family membrane protein [Poseidonocella sedimentorum]|uniref:Inner membrane protein YgaP-like transmembrane domain-containing protein n=1 Tax=Poseidonocella sedimentorum TaxID=871652 RepID=A0A1I6DT33_9RHOB|nr:DUF2892 domain-containing protein [Poseidonocella sedimentorum]SFR08527.1 Protein of unknown function [Poseidonocella sedimentorum]
MSTNVGTLDRALRVLLGLALLALPLLAPLGGFWTGISLIIGLVFLATAALRLCPIYAIFNIRTCK